MKLRGRILFPALFLIFFGIAVVAFSGYLLSSKALTDVSREQILHIAEAVGARIDDWMKSRMDQVTAWSGLDMYPASLSETLVGRSARARVKAHMAQILEENPFYETLLLVNPSGIVLASPQESNEGIDVSARDYFQSAMKGVPRLGEPIPSRVAGAGAVAVVATPIPARDGSVAGVLAAVVTLDRLSTSIIDGIKVGERGYAYMVDGRGFVISHPVKEHVMKLDVSALPFGAQIMKGEGVAEYEFQGERKMAALRRCPNTGWILAVTADFRDLLAPARRAGLLSAAAALGMLLLSALVMQMVVRGIVRPISDVAKVLARRGELDFTIDKADMWMLDRSKADDEIAQMIKAMITLRVNVEEMVRTIRSRSDAFSKSAESLAALSEEAVASMQEVKSSIETVLSLSEENTEGIRRTADGLSGVASSSSTAAATASNGAVVVSETSETSERAVAKVGQAVAKIRTAGDRTEESSRSMEGVATSVESIGKFVATIKSIADQTNLLALNAAIEAARAGEAGRGFAVVADEVRKLAEESNHAAREVESLIASLQQETKRALFVTNEAGGVMKETVCQAEEAMKELEGALDRIGLMNGLMRELESAAREQEASAMEMSRSIEQVNGGTTSLTGMFAGIRSAAEDTSGASECVAREAASFAEGAGEMLKIVECFRIEERYVGNSIAKRRGSE